MLGVIHILSRVVPGLCSFSIREPIYPLLQTKPTNTPPGYSSVPEFLNP